MKGQDKQSERVEKEVISQQNLNLPQINPAQVPDQTTYILELQKQIQNQKERIDKLEDLLQRQQSNIANQSLSAPTFDQRLVEEVLVNPVQSNPNIYSWNNEEPYVNRNNIVFSEPFAESSFAPNYAIMGDYCRMRSSSIIIEATSEEVSEKVEKLKQRNCEQEEEQKEPDYTQGIITQEQVDYLTQKYQKNFDELKLNQKNLNNLMSHPITLISQGKQSKNAEKYFLLQKTIKTFTDLVSRAMNSQAATIKLMREKNFESTKDLGGIKPQDFENLSSIEDQYKYVIIPCYYKQESHWCFILIYLDHQGGKHKVYLVDSAQYFQNVHRSQMKNIESGNKKGVWSNLISQWIDLQFKNLRNRCMFEVLKIKNQGNNFDCGLIMCLLIWQFYQSQNVQDLLEFPWDKEYSQHYRLALARALATQNLDVIVDLVQAKRKKMANQ